MRASRLLNIEDSDKKIDVTIKYVSIATGVEAFQLVLPQADYHIAWYKIQNCEYAKIFDSSQEVWSTGLEVFMSNVEETITPYI